MRKLANFDLGFDPGPDVHSWSIPRRARRREMHGEGRRKASLGAHDAFSATSLLVSFTILFFLFFFFSFDHFGVFFYLFVLEQVLFTEPCLAWNGYIDLCRSDLTAIQLLLPPEHWG